MFLNIVDLNFPGWGMCDARWKRRIESGFAMNVEADIHECDSLGSRAEAFRRFLHSQGEALLLPKLKLRRPQLRRRYPQNILQAEYKLGAMPFRSTPAFAKARLCLIRVQHSADRGIGDRRHALPLTPTFGEKA
ncbi:MAG: hypothetical protein LBU32_30475 [Clostridiales bacterium]|nr:hypothetical protein [Clostridiales bacterium]